MHRYFQMTTRTPMTTRPHAHRFLTTSSKPVRISAIGTFGYDVREGSRVVGHMRQILMLLIDRAQSFSFLSSFLETARFTSLKHCSRLWQKRVLLDNLFQNVSTHWLSPFKLLYSTCDTAHPTPHIWIIC